MLYLSSTSNHNLARFLASWKELCYIFLLHQTTTPNRLLWKDWQLCYIFLLHQTTTGQAFIMLLKRLCYIFLLHQTTTQYTLQNKIRCCVISFFYIKPQLFLIDYCGKSGCVISFFYIKPQRESRFLPCSSSCVISFFYIKPQLPWLSVRTNRVVLYLSSTSNHNFQLQLLLLLVVVLYLSSTSNHNHKGVQHWLRGLCYIFLLHQTTTSIPISSSLIKLCYIFLLHQTTTIGQVY